MKLHQITLPKWTNKGDSYTDSLIKWEEDTLGLAGGYTRIGEAEGAWLDTEDSDKLYRETMVVYQVACETWTLVSLIAMARVRFPDQIKFAVCELGEFRLI